MTAPSPASQEPADSDLRLVERTVAGDQRAYELLVIKYQRRIERLVGRMVRDVDLIPDITQETFLRAYRALHQFRGEAQFYTWLYRIAVNTAKKALLDIKRDPVITESSLRGGGDEDDETSLLDRELTSDETPATVLAAQEVAAAGQRRHGGVARGFAPGRHTAGDRGFELRGNFRGHVLPHRHRALADFPGP